MSGSDPESLPESDDDEWFLDLSGEKCPMTFVKTRLLIEEMEAGETARLLLSGRDNLDSVRRTLASEKQEILSCRELSLPQRWHLCFRRRRH